MMLVSAALGPPLPHPGAVLAWLALLGMDGSDWASLSRQGPNRAVPNELQI